MPLKTPYFQFNRRHISRGHFSEQIALDNPFSRKVAEPLFSIDLAVAGMTERSRYASAPLGSAGRPHHTFTLILQGEMEIALNNRITTIGPGKLVCAPAGTRFQRRGKGATWWLYFEFRNTERWAPLKEVGPYIRRYEHAPLLFMHLRTILDAQNKGDSISSTLAHCSATFLADLLTNEMNVSVSGQTVHLRDLERLMNEIARNPEKPWRINEMASRTSLSKSHLSALFKAHYGLSPIEAVIKQRMLRAIHLLVREHVSVKQTAFTVGYQSPLSFTRLFTKRVGMSPKQYTMKYRAPVDCRVISHGQYPRHALLSHHR